MATFPKEHKDVVIPMKPLKLETPESEMAAIFTEEDFRADYRILNHVCISVNRMLRLIDQMLDFNQQETDELRLRVVEVDAAKELCQQETSKICF